MRLVLRTYSNCFRFLAAALLAFALPAAADDPALVPRFTDAERRANRRLVELETAGGNGDFAEALVAIGCTVAPGIRRRLKVVLPEGTGPRDLYRLAGEKGVQIRHLAYQRDSLEEIFLRAMENGS